jgi:hypothetical protein
VCHFCCNVLVIVLFVMLLCAIGISLFFLYCFVIVLCVICIIVIYSEYGYCGNCYNIVSILGLGQFSGGCEGARVGAPAVVQLHSWQQQA